MTHELSAVKKQLHFLNANFDFNIHHDAEVRAPSIAIEDKLIEITQKSAGSADLVKLIIASVVALASIET